MKTTDDKYIQIPLNIGKFILDNSLYKLSELVLHESYNNSVSVNIKRKEDIDEGVSGIILFLVELNRIQPDKRYKKLLTRSGVDLVNFCKKTSRSHFGYYKGRAGVCYTLMMLSEATGEEKFLEFAIEHTKNGSDYFINSEFTSNCLYDGRSGLLLYLLHLFNNKNEDWILEKINICLDKIISDFVFTDEGVVWSKRDLNINPLNSFLFGSSGVAFVLFQVGMYFVSSELLSIAKSIFVYEDKHWNNEKSNWPDFRKEIITCEDYKIHKQKYSDKKFNFFTIPSESFDWAYGTTGICLARFPFLKGENIYQIKTRTEIGITKLLNFKTENLSLANGLSGIGTLFIEASKYLNISSFYGKIVDIANILINKELYYQDMSLLYGITGIGYFLLQYYNPEDFQSILLPVLKKNKHLTENRVTINCNQHILKSFQLNFPYTFITLQTIIPEQYSDFIKQCDFTIYDNPMDLIRTFIYSFENIMLTTHIQLITDIFALESAKLQMYVEKESLSMNHIKEIIKFEDRVALMNMDEQELFNQSLVFNEDTRIVKARWNWTRFNQQGADFSKIIFEFLATDPKEVKLLLYRNSSNKIIEEKLDSFGQLTHMIFQEPQVVRNTFTAYLDAFRIKNNTDRNQILTHAKQYIKYYIKKSLLQMSM